MTISSEWFDDLSDWGHERPDWQRLAKCRGMALHDPELFFPDKGGDSQWYVDRAKAICNGNDGWPVCPVRKTCLEYALANQEQFGVWGGLSKRERDRVAKVRRLESAKKRQ